MGCGYACINCGRCKGIVKPLQPYHCFFCKTDNVEGATFCSNCGKALPVKPGEPSVTTPQHDAVVTD